MGLGRLRFSFLRLSELSFCCLGLGRLGFCLRLPCLRFGGLALCRGLLRLRFLWLRLDLSIFRLAFCGLHFSCRSPEYKKANRESWNWVDVAASLFVVGCVIAAYAYFWTWLD